jgi:putative transcriptional regulator
MEYGKRYEEGNVRYILSSEHFCGLARTFFRRQTKEVEVMQFKCRLKVIFAERDIKQGEFAEKIGVSLGTLSAIVNNRSLPSFPVAYAICEELGMTINEIWIKKEPTQSE